MKIEFNNSKEYLNRLNTLVYATVGLPLLLFIVVYLMQEKHQLVGLVQDATVISLLNYIFLTLVVGFLVSGYVLFKKQKKEAQAQPDLRTKLDALAQATFKKFMLFFVSTNVAVLGMYLTGEKFYSGLFVFVLIFISISNPSLYRILRDLQLNKEDGQKVLNQEPID